MDLKTSDKATALAGTVSGSAAILGSWQICHSICLGIIAVLSVVGISVVSMPLMFLTSLAKPLWWLAIGLFGVTFFVSRRHACLPKTLLMINGGLLIAGTPYARDLLQVVLWILGGVVVSYSTIHWIFNKHRKVKCHANP